MLDSETRLLAENKPWKPKTLNLYTRKGLQLTLSETQASVWRGLLGPRFSLTCAPYPSRCFCDTQGQNKGLEL